MFESIRLISKLVGMIILFLFILFFIFYFAGELFEPIYSKNKLNPVAEQIAKRLISEMPIPPSHEYLKQFTKSLMEEGVVKNDWDISLSYIQIAGYSDYKVHVTYYKQLAHMFLGEGKAEIAGDTHETHYHDVDIVISSDFEDSQELTVSKTEQAFKEGQNLLSDKEVVMDDQVETNISNSLSGNEYPSYDISAEDTTEESPTYEKSTEDLRIFGLFKDGKLIADFTNAVYAKEYADVQGFTDYEVSDLTEEWRQSIELELPEFSVFVWNENRASFFNQKEAVAYAKQFHHSNVFIPNSVIWSNISVSLFKDETFVGRYDSEADAIQDAMNMEKAKLIDIETGKVIWDNYLRECPTCESAIQDQYE
jgi:hypothetical protein